MTPRSKARKSALRGGWGVTVDGVEVLRDPDAVVAGLQRDEVVGVDTETTGLSPWRNDIALVQLYGEQSGTLGVIQVRQGELHPAVHRLLESGKTFVVHNGVGFDLMFLDQAGVRWRKSRWHDTLVGETLLATTGRRDVRKNLGDSIRRRLGKEIDKEIEHGHWADTELSPRQVEYAAQDVLSLPALYRTQLSKADSSGQAAAMAMEMELMPTVAQMTINGLPCLRARVAAYVEKQEAAIAEAGRRLRRKFGADINMRSQPQVLAALQAAGYPVESTGKEVLIPIAQLGGKRAALIEDLLTYRHGDQRIKMYSEEWMDGIVNDRIHPHFWQCSADTTRFTCTHPNLQQVPKDGRGDIIGGVRGLTIVSVDYSQIEVRIAGYLSGDAVLMELLEAGDVHTAVAAAVFRVTEGEVTPRQRKLAKAMVFLLLFGGGAAGFYEYVKMSGGTITEDEARGYVQRFFATFTGLARMRNWAAGLADRRSSAPVVIKLPNGSKRVLVGYNRRLTTILNTLVQGTAAVGIKYGMLEATRRGLDAYMGGQVHDEIVAAVPSREAREYGQEMKEALIVGMKRVLHTTVKAEVKAGPVWQP